MHVIQKNRVAQYGPFVWMHTFYNGLKNTKLLEDGEK